MPPKGKKESEQQAKKLQEQRKKREEQQARLEAERKKYLGETLPTGLFLPASRQLILDFPHKTLDFLSEKLKDAFKQTHPNLSQSHRISFLLKQLHYFIKDSYSVFGIPKQDQNLTKHRIFVAIMFELLLHAEKQRQGSIKARQEDQRKLKQLVTIHCQKIEGWDSLSKNDGLLILKYAKQVYFSKFLLIKMFDRFPKKKTQSKFNLYMQTPTIYLNSEQTKFVDLSQKAKDH